MWEDGRGLSGRPRPDPRLVSHCDDRLEGTVVDRDRNYPRQMAVWHGKGSKGLERIKALDSRLRAKEGIRIQYLVVDSEHCLELPEEKRAHVGQPRRRASQGAADRQQHRRVCGEPGCQLTYRQETPDAVDRRRRALRGTSQGCGVERRILPRCISVLKIGASRCGACVRAASAGEDRPTDRTDGEIMPQAMDT